MAMIELVDYNEIYNAAKPAKKKSTRRGKGAKKIKTPVVETPDTKNEEE